MKLYTEEQVYKVLWELEHPFSDGKEIDKIVSKLIPIELPSDDEVCDKAEKIAHNYFDMHNTNHYKGLEEGAKRMGAWFVEQIKQQSDGN